MEADDLERCTERLNDMDAKLARSISGRYSNLMEYKAIMSYGRARYNRANLLGKEAGHKTVKRAYMSDWYDLSGWYDLYTSWVMRVTHLRAFG